MVRDFQHEISRTDRRLKLLLCQRQRPTHISTFIGRHISAKVRRAERRYTDISIGDPWLLRIYSLLDQNMIIIIY